MPRLARPWGGAPELASGQGARRETLVAATGAAQLALLPPHLFLDDYTATVVVQVE